MQEIIKESKESSYGLSNDSVKVLVVSSDSNNEKIIRISITDNATGNTAEFFSMTKEGLTPTNLFRFDSKINGVIGSVDLNTEKVDLKNKIENN